MVLVGEVLKRLERRGYKIERLEMRTNVPNHIIDQHYEALLTKEFYPRFVSIWQVDLWLLVFYREIKWFQVGKPHDGCYSSRNEALPGTFVGILRKQLRMVQRFKMLSMVQILKYQTKLPFGSMKNEAININVRLREEPH